MTGKARRLWTLWLALRELEAEIRRAVLVPGHYGLKQSYEEASRELPANRAARYLAKHLDESAWVEVQERLAFLARKLPGAYYIRHEEDLIRTAKNPGAEAPVSAKQTEMNWEMLQFSKIRRGIQRKLRRIEASRQKARDALWSLVDALEFQVKREPATCYCEALAFFGEKNQLPRKAIRRVERLWKEAASRQGSPTGSKLWWLDSWVERFVYPIISQSRNPREEHVGRIRAWHYLGLEGFDDVFEMATEATHDNLLVSIGMYGTSDINSATAEAFWWASRTSNISGDVMSTGRQCIRLIIRNQEQDGSWHQELFSLRDMDRRATVPNARMTAQLCLVLRRMGNTDEALKVAQEAAWWLRVHQDPRGYWCEMPDLSAMRQRIRKDYASMEKPSILVTTLATKALLESGIDVRSEQLSKTRDWLMGSQRKLGYWLEPPHSWPVLSVLVLEAIDGLKEGEPPKTAKPVKAPPVKESEFRPSEMPSWVLTAQCELSLSNYIKSWRLALQGTEADQHLTPCEGKVLIILAHVAKRETGEDRSYTRLKKFLEPEARCRDYSCTNPQRALRGLEKKLTELLSCDLIQHPDTRGYRLAPAIKAEVSRRDKSGSPVKVMLKYNP